MISDPLDSTWGVGGGEGRGLEKKRGKGGGAIKPFFYPRAKYFIFSW